MAAQDEKGFTCEVYRKDLQKSLSRHEVKIESHSERINILEQHKSRVEVQITNLIDDIQELIKTIRWAGVALITSGLGFIVWYIQQI